MTSRDRHARPRAEACHIRLRQGQVLQGCARDTSGRVETVPGSPVALRSAKRPFNLAAVRAALDSGQIRRPFLLLSQATTTLCASQAVNATTIAQAMAWSWRTAAVSIPIQLLDRDRPLI